MYYDSRLEIGICSGTCLCLNDYNELQFKPTQKMLEPLEDLLIRDPNCCQKKFEKTRLPQLRATLGFSKQDPTHRPLGQVLLNLTEDMRMNENQRLRIV